MKLIIVPLLQTLYFTLQVFKLFASLTEFFNEEKQKSSTELVKSVHDEWLQVFSRDVYLTLFKTFYKICQFQGRIKKYFLFL